MYGYKIMTPKYYIVSFSRTLYWSRMASFRLPYKSSRVYSGLCSTMGCVSSSGFLLTIPASSNSHSHWFLTWYPACVIGSNRYLGFRIFQLEYRHTSCWRMTYMPMPKRTVLLVHCFGLGAVLMYTIYREFRWFIRVHFYQALSDSRPCICRSHVKAFLL